MLAETVAILDIRDAEGFVQATINRARLVLQPDEREELVATGLEILVDLAGKYRPHIDGHAQEGRFSGYAAMYLPRKLGDAWHRMHPEHLLVTQADGSRKWTYREKAVSLEAMMGDDPDRQPLLANQPTGEAGFEDRVDRALREYDDRFREQTVKVAALLGEGATYQDAARILGMPPQLVREHVMKLALIADRLRTGG